MTQVERFVLTMASITETAETFFVACETGKGWQECRAHCHPDATFSAQAGALAAIETLVGRVAHPTARASGGGAAAGF